MRWCSSDRQWNTCILKGLRCKTISQPTQKEVEKQKQLKKRLAPQRNRFSSYGNIIDYRTVVILVLYHVCWSIKCNFLLVKRTCHKDSRFIILQFKRMLTCSKSGVVFTCSCRNICLCFVSFLVVRLMRTNEYIDLKCAERGFHYVDDYSSC